MIIGYIYIIFVEEQGRLQLLEVVENFCEVVFVLVEVVFKLDEVLVNLLFLALVLD